jgi:hypothetical protein
VTIWLVSVFSTKTDELLVQHEASPPVRALVREEWGLPIGSPIGELLVTSERLPFVNRLLEKRLELREAEEAYLGEVAECDGEVVDD